MKRPTKASDELRVWVETNLAVGTGCTITAKRSLRRLISALINAVREDCAKEVAILCKADNYHGNLRVCDVCKYIAAAIRGGKGR